MVTKRIRHLWLLFEPKTCSHSLDFMYHNVWSIGNWYSYAGFGILSKNTENVVTKFKFITSQAWVALGWQWRKYNGSFRFAPGPERWMMRISWRHGWTSRIYHGYMLAWLGYHQRSQSSPQSIHNLVSRQSKYLQRKQFEIVTKNVTIKVQEDNSGNDATHVETNANRSLARPSSRA